jgi:hypothetical protein
MTETVTISDWPEASARIRHILSLSGGKDSAALAVHMRDRVPIMEYIFHDTGKELPDTLAYLERLEGYLGRKITRTTFGTTFDSILRMKGGMLPSNHRRWCTELMKLKPFENYIGSDFVINYVGIRADEDRVGYISHKPNIRAVFPFRDDGRSRTVISDEHQDLMGGVKRLGGATPKISVTVRQLDFAACCHPPVYRHDMPENVRLMDCSTEPLAVKNSMERNRWDDAANFGSKLFAFPRDNRFQDHQTTGMRARRNIPSEGRIV